MIPAALRLPCGATLYFRFMRVYPIAQINVSYFCKTNYSTNLSRDSVMNIFDRKSKLLQKNRASSMEKVELYDYLKEEVGWRMSDRVFDIKRKFGSVVDLGCGRGYVSKNIINDCVDNLIMCDMSEIALEQASLPEQGIKVEKQVVNEEELPFESDSLDLVITSLALHWVNDLPGTFRQVIRCLKNDGAFMGAIFGGDTLFELRCSLQLAEMERAGGVSAHVSPFTDVSDLGGLLSHAGFTLLTLDTDEIVINYPTIFELMWDLKGMGENNCAWRRSAHLHRDVMLAAAAIYQNMYGSEEKIPATFQVIYFLAWKPDASQPKPAPRGSATRSFRDLSPISPPKKKPA